MSGLQRQVALTYVEWVGCLLERVDLSTIVSFPGGIVNLYSCLIALRCACGWQRGERVFLFLGWSMAVVRYGGSLDIDLSSLVSSQIGLFRIATGRV